jgi:hypothetical protein
MTFEEFKRNFEIFAKIDTPEKLAICELQYHAHLMAMEGNNFFEPFVEKTDDLDRVSVYTKNLYSILNFNQINKAQILFLIQPSFDPESLLVLENLNNNYALSHFALEENYWYRYYADNSITTGKTILSKGYLKKSIGDQIFQLIEQSMKAAKKSEPGRFVLDGVKYKLSKIIGEHRIDVVKHSPENDSKTGRIIQLLETVLELTKPNASEDSERKIASLLALILNSQ